MFRSLIGLEVKKISLFLDSSLGRDALRRVLAATIVGVETGADDVVLAGCFVHPDSRKAAQECKVMIPAALYFPKWGRVQNYNLNSRLRALTNIHRNPDTLIVCLENSIKIDTSTRDNFIERHRWHIRYAVPNNLHTAFFCKRSPFENPQEYACFGNLNDYPPMV